MNLNKFTFKWWQAAIYEMCVVSFGIIIGSYWAKFWLGYMKIIIAIFIITGIYLVWAFFKGEFS